MHYLQTFFHRLGDAVMDPFAGSGTFGTVAIEMNRIPILCEQNNDYCNIINIKGEYNEI